MSGRAALSAAAVATDFADNIAHGVRWYDLTTGLEELGYRLFIEMPPGQVLSEVAMEGVPLVTTLAIDESSLRYALRLADLD